MLSMVVLAMERWVRWGAWAIWRARRKVRWVEKVEVGGGVRWRCVRVGRGGSVAVDREVGMVGS